METSDKNTEKSKSNRSDPQSVPLEARVGVDEPPRRHEREDTQYGADGEEGEASGKPHQADLVEPALDTRTRKKRPRPKRSQSPPSRAQDILQLILDGLSASVNVTENGASRKMPIGKVGARALVQAVVKSDPVAFAQLLQVLRSLERSDRDKPNLDAQTARKNFKEIMLDFRRDMREEAYQALHDETGETAFSDEELSEKCREALAQKHPKFADPAMTMSMMYLMSLSLSDLDSFDSWVRNLTFPTVDGVDALR